MPPAPRRFRIILDDDTSVRASSVVIASGARYRRLDLDNLGEFEGEGVYYWATPIEAKLCAMREVIVVGGGNSAGQAAVFLAAHAGHVHILVRGPSLAATMSRYLIDRIEALPNVTLHGYPEITRLNGNRETGLHSVFWKNRRSGAEEERDVRHVFLFIGADPNTEWLKACPIEVDAHGFICTGLVESASSAAAHADAARNHAARRVRGGRCSRGFCQARGLGGGRRLRGGFPAAFISRGVASAINWRLPCHGAPHDRPLFLADRQRQEDFDHARRGRPAVPDHPGEHQQGRPVHARVRRDQSQ